MGTYPHLGAFGIERREIGFWTHRGHSNTLSLLHLACQKKSLLAGMVILDGPDTRVSWVCPRSTCNPSRQRQQGSDLARVDLPRCPMLSRVCSIRSAPPLINGSGIQFSPPLCTPPIPPVANTLIPARCAAIIVVDTVVPPSACCRQTRDERTNRGRNSGIVENRGLPVQ
jgi:hypothetical protein